jgi:hypothetical protein
MAIATCFEPVSLARFCLIVCCAKPWNARDAFIEVLEGYTLSDLVSRGRGCKRCCLLRLSNPFEHTPAHEGAGENRVGGCCRLGFRAEVHQ